MTVLIEAESFSWENFLTFQYQVAVLLLVSIILPMLTSAISIAYKRPLVILSADQANGFTKRQNPIIFGIDRAFIILLFPIVPAMIVISGEKAKEKRESLKCNDTTLEDLAKESFVEECKYLTKHIEETRSALLTFKRNELSLELVIQLVW